MVETITGGLSTSGGEGAKVLAGEALGLSDKKPEKEARQTDEEQSMQKKIVRLLAEGKPDKIIRDMVGCSDAQLQVVKMYIGDIKDKVRVEEEKAVVVGEKAEEEEEVDDAPKKVWDPFETKEEKKKKEARKVKLVPAIWDPLSPDKPLFIEVPDEKPAPVTEEEKEDVDVAEEAVKISKLDADPKSRKEQVKKLLEAGELSQQGIADKLKISRSYVARIKGGM